MVTPSPTPLRTRPIAPVANEGRLEVTIDLIHDLPPARQKRVILRMRDPAVRMLDDDQARFLMDLYGLAGA